MSADRLPPGPEAPSPLQALRLSRDPLGFLSAARERHGDVFTLRLWRVGAIVVVAEPHAVGMLLDGDPAFARAGDARRALLPILPEGSALGSDADMHAERRGRLLPVLAAPALERLLPRLAAVAGEHIAAWPVGRPYALLPRARRLAVELFVREVLAIRDVRRARPVVRAALRMMWSPVVAPGLWVPDPGGGVGVRSGWALFKALRRPLDALVRAEVAGRRRRPAAAERDVLDALICDGVLDEQQVVDEVVGLLIAATEPLGVGLTWMLERLARHPAAAAYARENGDAAVRAVVLETLHTRPAIIDAGRRLTRPVTVGGHRLAAGTSIMVAVPLVHGVAGVHQAFRPERWLNDTPCPSVPFGGGTRTCLGATLTMQAGRALLPVVLERLVLRAPGPEERVALRGTALVPHRGGRISASRRDDRRQRGDGPRRRKPRAGQAEDDANDGGAP